MALSVGSRSRTTRPLMTLTTTIRHLWRRMRHCPHLRSAAAIFGEDLREKRKSLKPLEIVHLCAHPMEIRMAISSSNSSKHQSSGLIFRVHYKMLLLLSSKCLLYLKIQYGAISNNMIYQLLLALLLGMLPDLYSHGYEVYDMRFELNEVEARKARYPSMICLLNLLNALIAEERDLSDRGRRVLSMYGMKEENIDNSVDLSQLGSVVRAYSSDIQLPIVELMKDFRSGKIVFMKIMSIWG